MFEIDHLRDFYDRLDKKYQKKKNYLHNRYGLSASGVKDKASASKDRVSKSYRNSKNTFKNKWNNKWKHYKDYFVWDLAPWVLAYGTPLAFIGANVIGDPVSFSPRWVLTTGLSWYFVKQELPELADDFRGRSSIEG